MVESGRFAIARVGQGQPRPIVWLVFSLAWLYVAPSPLLTLAAMVLFAALAWRWLDRALCVLPLSFPFWYVPKPLVGHIVFPLSEIALGICLGVALVRLAQHTLLAVSSGQTLRVEVAGAAREVIGRIGPWLALGAGLLLVGGVLGVLVARRPHDALRAFRWEVLEPLVYLVLVATCVRQRAGARLLAWAFLGAAAVVAGLAYLQVLWLHVTFTPLADGSQLVRYVGAEGGFTRATGMIYGSANNLGAWLGRALPLALALGVAARGLARRERLLALGCAGFLVAPLLWSESRGAQLAAAVACALVLVAAAGRVREALWVVLAGALVALWQRGPLFQALLQGHSGTGRARLFIWLGALRMLRDHPVLGIGPDQFLYYYSARYTAHPYWVTEWDGKPTKLGMDPTLSHPHNLPLDLWLSVGLVGLAGFALALGNFWLRCMRLWRAGAAASAGRWPAALALGIGASVFAGVLHGLVDNGYFLPDLALAFWMSAALIVVLERGSDAPHPSPSQE